MTPLRIYEYGEPILRRKCLPVKKITAEILQDLKNMKQVLYKEERGIGLAAPQIGLNKRLVVIDIGEGLWQLINPRIISRRGKSVLEEGCLSVPGIQVKVKRAREVNVEALNPQGEKIIIEGRDLFAHVLQHEIDHLNGILIIDFLPRGKKKKAEAALKEWAKETAKKSK